MSQQTYESTSADKIRFNLDFLKYFQEQKGFKLIEEYKDQLNRNSIIKGKCATTGCSNSFEKTFDVLVKKCGPFCKNCTQSAMVTKIKTAKWSEDASKKRWDLKALQEFCKENSINLTAEYAVVNRDTIITAHCTSQGCSEIFERRFRWIVDPRGSGSKCERCVKIKMDEISRQNIKKYNEKIQEGKPKVIEEKNDVVEEKNEVIEEKKEVDEEKNEVDEEKNEVIEEKKEVDEEKISFDIIDYLNKNPQEKLLCQYETKLLSKIKYSFTAEEQQLFVTSFYCYLKYDPNVDFVIDLDNIWRWCGFTRRDNAKRLLLNHFKIDCDYKIFHINLDIQVAPPIGGASLSKKHGGQNKENIMLTVNTFKKLCMKAGTKKADEILNNFLKLEDILHKTIVEDLEEKIEFVNSSKTSQISNILHYDKELILNNISITCRASDGFVNLTEMSKAGKHRLDNFLKRNETKLFLESLNELPKFKGVKILTTTEGKNGNTWSHRLVAYYYAQYISPQFAVQVCFWLDNLFLTGRVELGQEKTLQELENIWKEKCDVLTKSLEQKDKQIISLHKSLNQYEKAHHYKKFNTDDPAYYVFTYGRVCHSECPLKNYAKHGIATKSKNNEAIDKRLQSHRTTFPMLNLEFLVYASEDAIVMLEKTMELRYGANLNPNNHEVFEKVPIDTLKKTAIDFLEVACPGKYRIEDKEKIDEYNKDVECTHKENVQVPVQIVNNTTNNSTDNSVTNNNITVNVSIDLSELKQLLKDIEKLTLEKLKPHLEKFGLPKSGNKQSKLDALKKYINEKINNVVL